MFEVMDIAVDIWQWLNLLETRIEVKFDEKINRVLHV